MSLHNWKTLQRSDSLACGLVTNCDRAARPNSPDGILPLDALKHLGVFDLIESIKWKKNPTGWFPECKAGYSYLPSALQKQVIDESKKEANSEYDLFFCEKDGLAFFRRGNFYQYINSVLLGTPVDYIGVNVLSYKVPQYLIDWLDQAIGYLSLFPKNSPLKHPFVSWHPKPREGKRPRFDDALIVTRMADVEEFFL